MNMLQDLMTNVRIQKLITQRQVVHILAQQEIIWEQLDLQIVEALNT